MHSRQTYARLLLVGAVIGAMLALTSTFVFSAPFEPEASAPGSAQQGQGDEDTDEESPPLETAFSASQGDCVTWSEGDVRDMRTVPCDEEHLFEVTAVIDVSTDYPSDAPPPDMDQWQEIVDERCTEPADAYLDSGLDPHGRFKVSAIFPNDTDWEAGQRLVHCGLWWLAPGGEPQPMTASVAGLDQSNVWDVGTCLGLEDNTVGDPVDCAEPHSYEMIAVVDLAEEFGEDYPSESDQMSWLDTECAEHADSYTDGMDLADNDLIVAWDTREEASWEAGSRLVNCKVGRVLEDESGLAPVTGSVAADAEDGQDTEDSGGTDDSDDTDSE
ncbi:septum formation family protein [Haloechinothrix sp. LS1_15]|nr:septum formation family protein [Haloechinothrix sp. LS1_15]